MRVVLVLMVAFLFGAACDDDSPPWVCSGEPQVAGDCGSGTTTFEENLSRSHIEEPDELVYSSSPPSSGDHRPYWALWGEHEFLTHENWVHNLEHGGVALLYHPCADPEVIDSLRTWARARPDDDGGPFRWILTPYPDLPTMLAVVAWEWTYEAECFNETEVAEFVDAHYRQAPEDLGNQGSAGPLHIGL